MKTSLIVSLVVFLLSAIFLVNKGYQLNRDVKSVAHRAQVAADVPDMLEYMKEMRSGMERHNMTRGNTALVFKTPANDLSKLGSSITSIINRLEAIKNIPQTETTYQVALDDIRGTIRELEDPCGGFLWAKYWYVFVLGIIAIVWVMLFLIFYSYGGY